MDPSPAECAGFGITERNMDQRNNKPEFYRIVAFAFLIISGILFYAAITRHQWFYWAMAIITLINALMTVLKHRTVRGQDTNG